MSLQPEIHSSAPKRSVVIVAGGKGLRMGGDIPKQFVPVKGLPVLMHTINRFRQFDSQMQIILVLPQAQQDYWHKLCEEYAFAVPLDIVSGGETRFHSVKNGLAHIREDVQLVGVHDGVRPFVSVDTIGSCYEEAQKSGAAIPVIEIVETVRQLVPEGSVTVPRSEYRLVQTPQVFDCNLLREAYAQPYTDLFTDDASVVESFGHAVTLVPGNRENIKLTTPFDLAVAEVL